MLPTTRASRQIFCGALVLVLSVLSVVAARKNYTPSSPPSPAYRQKGAGQVVIVEYSDFQCPACGAAAIPLKRIVDIYGKDIQVHFKHFPLEQVHKWARTGARATECAGRQGKFWELHDLLFKNQYEWSQHEDAAKDIAGYVNALELDGDAFKACMSDPAVDAGIDADVDEGNNRWVRSTPTFFINGKRFVGAHQLSTVGTLWLEKQIKK